MLIYARHNDTIHTSIVFYAYLCKLFFPHQAAKNDGKLSIDVKQIMDTWTLQMGYPVVTVTREYGREDGSLRFKADQRRFLMNPQSNTTSQYGDMG